jgi:hypothetical protein
MHRLLYIYQTILRFPLLIAIVLSLGVSPASATVQTVPPDLSEYESWLREAFAAAQRGDRIGLEDVAGRLAAVTAVRFPDGTVVTVDNAWLQEALASPTPDLTLIGARLGALIDALAQPPSSAPADALDRLERILDAPPFNRPTFEPPQWLIDALGWLIQVIETISRPVSVVLPQATNVVAWIIVLVGIVLLLAVMIYLAISVQRGIVRDARIEVQNDNDVLTATGAFNQASFLARDGDYRSAVRYLCLSVLLWLDDRTCCVMIAR